MSENYKFEEESKYTRKEFDEQKPLSFMNEENDIYDDNDEIFPGSKELSKDEKIDIFNKAHSLLFEVLQNSECEEPYPPLISHLKMIRKLAKKQLFSIDDIRIIPEFIQELDDTVGLSESTENVCAALATIWCLISRIPAVIPDFIRCNCIAACVSKVQINYDKSIVQALVVLYIILDSDNSIAESVFENISVETLKQIVVKMSNDYEENPELETGHRNLLNSAALLLIEYTKYIIRDDLCTEDNLQELEGLIFIIMNQTQFVAVSYCYLCLYLLLKHDKITVQEICEIEYPQFFDSTFKAKQEVNCSKASNLMQLMFEKGWKGTYFPEYGVMNFIKTCSDKAFEYNARELLAIACEKAAYSIKEVIMDNPDFSGLVLQAIAIEDETTHEVGYGEFRIMKYAGRALLGIINDPPPGTYETYYCYETMLCLLSLFRINEDDFTLKVIAAITRLIDYGTVSGRLEEIKAHFETAHGMDILDEYVDDENDEISEGIKHIIEALGLSDESDGD